MFKEDVTCLGFRDEGLGFRVANLACLHSQIQVFENGQCWSSRICKSNMAELNFTSHQFGCLS